MKRTTIVAEEGVLYRLGKIAEGRGVSLGEVIREALEEKLEREQPPLSFVGSASAGSIEGPSAREFDEENLYRAEDPRGAE